MQQKQMKKGGGQMPRRILSLLLALVMSFSLFSVGSLTTIAADLQDLEGVAGSNVTGNAQDGYTVERIENQNNFVGSSAKVEAFTYEADILISPDGSRKSTLVFGAAETGPDMSHPFFGMEVSAQPNNDKYDLYLTMFCELAVANPVYMFMNVPAGYSVDLTQPQHVEITVTPDKEFSVSINNTSVPVQMTANFADYYNGGYLGFMTYDTQAVFSNVKYSDEGSFVLDNGLTDLAGVVGNNVTGDAASGYTVAREEGQNNFVGSSTKVNAFTYEADILFKGDSNKATLTFGAPNEGAEMSHPFFGLELTAAQDGNLSLTMFYEKAVANAEWMFSGIPAGSGADLSEPQHIKVTVTPSKVFSVTVNDEPVTVNMPASFADYYNGGYLGFMTYDTEAVFSNVRYSDDGDFLVGEFITNLTGWRGVSGTWTELPEGYQGSGTGNVFAMSTTMVNSSDPFTYEAELNLPVGQQAGGIVFGVRDPANPLSKWFCLNVDRGGNACIFSETNGVADFIQAIPLSEEQKNQTTYQLKVERETENGPFNFYLDGNLIHTRELPEFPGGYFGLNACNATLTFNNVNYTVNGGTLEGFSTNLTGWKGLNGTWTEEFSGYKGVDAGKDTFAYADAPSVASDDTFIYEADVELKSGQYGAGITFGLQNPDNPTNERGEPDHLFALMVVKGGNSVFAFAHKDGKDEFVNTNALSAADQNTEIYHLRVEYLGSGVANFYVNGTLYHSFNLPTFEGGQFGLILATGTTATFNNVNYYSAVQPEITSITVEGAQMNEKFDPDVHAYMGSVPNGTTSVNITAECTEGLVLSIGNTTATSGQPVNVALGEDYNTIKVVARDPESGLSVSYSINIQQMFDEETIYDQEYRPTYHFTPYRHQMNDPNGLVYNEVTGEYHMFFQTNRGFDSGVGTGTTSWGHAVSKDMVNWQELPLAITPDDLGVIYSGSAVIDYNNTSGLFDESTPPGARMVAFYTNYGGDTTLGLTKQSMAYSTDNGRTWIKYENNPVVSNVGGIYGSSARDPKVFWYEDATMENGGIWVMVTVDYLEPHVHMFTSHNLIDWKHSGQIMDIDGNAFGSECPDLYPLALDGDEGNVKWVFRGGGVFYIVGHMEKTSEDTVMFVPETENIRPLNGISDQFPGIPEPELYATQSFSNEPNGRRVSISWIRERGGNVPGRIWNSAQSLPTEQTLRTVNGEPRLFSYPTEEVDAMRDQKIFELKGAQLDESSENVLKDVKSTNCDMDATITLGTATEVGFKLRQGGGRELIITYNKNDGKLYVDKRTSDGDNVLDVYKPDMSMIDGDTIKLRMMLDQICYDVYGNDGEVCIQGFFYNDLANNSMEFFTNGTVTLDLDIYSMKAMDRTLPDPEPIPTELSNLELSNGTLDPAFDKATLNYTATVANSVSSVKVMPTYTGDTAVTVNGKDVASGSYSEDIALDVGPNAITVVAGDKTYTITVTREEEEQPPVGEKPLLDGLELSEGTLTPAFDKDTFSYTAAVGNEVEGVQVKAFFADGITAMLGEEALESGVYSEEIPLQVGENEIVVTLRLEGEESEYVIIVTREEEAVTEPEPTPGTDKPSIPGSDEDQVGGGDWDWPSGSGNDSANGSGSGNSDKENPSSGDSSMIAGALAVLALSAGAVVVLSRKKK